MIDAYQYDLGTVQRGHISKWQDYEIVKQKVVYVDKSRPSRTYYDVFIDGDSEGVELTLKEARQYVKDLRDSYLENHPDEM